MSDITFRRVLARHRKLPRDMRRVRKSAFGQSRNSPASLRRQVCWLVRAEFNGRLVAYALSCQIGGDVAMACLDEVAVHVRHQRRGIGTVLSKEAVAWIRENGIDNVICKAIDPRMAKILDRLDLAHRASVWDREGQ